MVGGREGPTDLVGFSGGHYLPENVELDGGAEVDPSSLSEISFAKIKGDFPVATAPGAQSQKEKYTVSDA